MLSPSVASPIFIHGTSPPRNFSIGLGDPPLTIVQSSPRGCIVQPLSFTLISPNISINRDWQSADVFSMRNLYIVLIDHRILHGSVNFGMAQQSLHLFNRHSFVDCTRCQCTPEFMRMYFRNTQPSPQFTQPNLNAADLQQMCIRDSLSAVRLFSSHHIR